MGNTLTWKMGRQLASFGNISYAYNEDGIRTSKTSNGVTTKFYLDGTNIIEQTEGTTTLYFFYDSVGEIVGFKYNSNNYLYVKNSMGDIVGIADAAGNLITSYTYDAWGKVISVTGSNTVIGELNPFRYRSYYYDSDIQLYYLQSRYYDPEIGRFINSDDVNFIGVSNTDVSYNAFAYCGNNPTNGTDFTGYAYYLRNYVSTWFVRMLIKLFGTDLANGEVTFSFNKLGIKLIVTALALSYTLNPSALFKINGNKLSMSAGGISISLGGGEAAVSSSFTYKNVTTSIVSKLGKKSLAIGFAMMQWVKNSRANTKLNVGYKVLLEITYVALAGMAATVVAVSYVVPQVSVLLAHVAKTILSIYRNPTAVVATGKVLVGGLAAAF